MQRSSTIGSTTLALLVATAPSAMADGTLLDNAVLEMTFADGSGETQISAENDGTFLYTVSGGSIGGERFARYLQDGTLDLTAASEVDFRSIFTDNDGNLFAKEFGVGNVYSLTSDGVATFLYSLDDPESQSSADFNADDTELYTRDGSTIRRYDASNGAFISSFTLIGLLPQELDFPAYAQMETSKDGRIFTYADGVVSEWDLTGTRIGTCNIPRPVPDGFFTTWSFAVGGDNRIYLFNEKSQLWGIYDIGINSAPTFDPPSPCDETLMLSVGVPGSYTVVASDADGGEVSLTAMGTPAGATHTPSLPASGNPVAVDFDWTPSNADVGTYCITYFASDGRETTECKVTLIVAECHLVIADGRGNSQYTTGGHTYQTQLDGIRESYPVLLTDIPLFSIPAPTLGRKLGYVGKLQRFSVQVVMFNPDVFPENPEQSTHGLDVVIWPDGRIETQPYGPSDGMAVWLQTSRYDGSTYYWFPFSIEGM